MVGLFFLHSTTSVSVLVDSLTHLFFGGFLGTQTGSQTVRTTFVGGAHSTVGAQTTLLAGEQILVTGAQDDICVKVFVNLNYKINWDHALKYIFIFTVEIKFFNKIW